MSLIETRVGGRFRLRKVIAHGSFADVYIAQNVQTNEEVAVKLEDNRTKYPQLIYEAKIIYSLQGRNTGVPNLIWCGQEGDFNVLIMELLSDSIETLFNLCNRRFTLKTILMIAEQTIVLLEYIHNKGYLHRDIKPENLLMGSDNRSHLIHFIDFGLAKRFRDPKNGKHIPFRDDKRLTGTAIYASMNTHKGFEQSRRDDLESLGYVLVYLYKGYLPWDDFEGQNKQERYDLIYEKKATTPIEELCRGMPEEFMTYFSHCLSLRFEEKPDYTYLRRIFKELFIREGFEFDYIYDWILIPMSAQLELQNQKLSIDVELTVSDEFINQNVVDMDKVIENLPAKKPNKDDEEESVDQEQDDYNKANLKNQQQQINAIKAKGKPKPIETEYLRTDFEKGITTPKSNLIRSPKAVTSDKKANKDCNMF